MLSHYISKSYQKQIHLTSSILYNKLSHFSQCQVSFEIHELIIVEIYTIPRKWHAICHKYV